MLDSINGEPQSSASTSTPTIWSKVNLHHIFSVSAREYRGTQIFTALLIVGVFLSLNKFTRESLSSDVSSVLIEAKILKLISSIFVSTEIVGSIFHVFIMIIFGSLIEHIRGTYALLIFIIQICFISELLTLIIFLSLYYFTFDTFYLERHVCGFDAMIGAFIVCITEISPNSIVIPNFPFLTFQYLPFTLVCSVSVLHLIGLIAITQQCLVCCGTWVGWSILRYFAPSLSNAAAKGNDSEEFELQYLFPPILRFPVRHIANITYAVFKNVGCCESSIHDEHPTGTKGGGAGSTNLLSESLNDLVLNLNAQQSVTEDMDDGSDGDTFANSVIHNKYENKDDVEAKKRQEAKQMIEKRLQQIQKEYNQRILTSGKTDATKNAD